MCFGREIRKIIFKYTLMSGGLLSDHSKLDKTKVLKPCGSLMQVKRTAECSTGALCNTFDQH